jgi:hypothetical protein
MVGGIMSSEILKPDFKERSIEIRYSNDEVNIYVSKKGLEKLIELSSKLLEKPDIGHIHLEDYEVLTKESLITTIALFEK